MSETTALVAVVSGDAYVEFARQMFESAEEFFHPTENVKFLTLEGRSGWPDATMYRYHVLAEQLPRANYVYLLDADMLFVGHVGTEILPPTGIGLVGTQHPGYVGRDREMLPFERRSESVTYVSYNCPASTYFAGGFVGGERLSMRVLCHNVSSMIDRDALRGVVPCWHDESALNRVFADWPPTKTLSPSYCCPDNDSTYRTFWPEDYPRKIIALDKTAEVRGER